MIAETGGRVAMAFDAFISYSSKDKTAADAACAVLEGAGIRCWIAPRDIPAGAPWSAAIIEGIEDSRVLVLVFSANANASDQVLREVERAVAKKAPAKKKAAAKRAPAKKNAAAKKAPAKKKAAAKKAPAKKKAAAKRPAKRATRR